MDVVFPSLNADSRIRALWRIERNRAGRDPLARGLGGGTLALVHIREHDGVRHRPPRLVDFLTSLLKPSETGSVFAPIARDVGLATYP